MKVVRDGKKTKVMMDRRDKEDRKKKGFLRKLKKEMCPNKKRLLNRWDDVRKFI